MKRNLHLQILNDLAKKMVFVTGPRQVGKTFLAHQIMREFDYPQYLNFDIIEDRKIIHQRSWRLNADLIIFDEIHKMKSWKNYIKGIYDARSKNQAILVTGSSRLETYRQSGESLAGRYFHLRLNPLSVNESGTLLTSFETVEKLNKLGGFPEPFLSGSLEEAGRWRNQYFTDIIREDILEFSRIHEINSMKTLLELLRSRVGSPLSMRSLAEDLQISPNTIRKYIQILESLYIIFLIRPYHKNIARSILREPKVYFYDSGYIKGNEGIIFENTCAVCLLKYAQYMHDAKGKDINLNYMRTKDGKEIDFAIITDQIPDKLIEAKLTDRIPSRALNHFSKYFPRAQSLQLVHNLRQEEHIKGVDIIHAGRWLFELGV